MPIIKFYQKTWFIWVALFIFAPIGIFLLLKYTNYKKSIKIAISCYFGLMYIIFLLLSASNNYKNKDIPSNKTEQIQATAKPITKPNKDKIDELDIKVWSTATASERGINIFKASIDDFSKNNLSELDFYDIAKKTEENQSNLFNSLPTGDENSKKYIESVETYIATSKYIAKNIKKYLESKNIKDISEAKSDLQSLDNYALNIVSQRNDYLSKNGFTQDEIKKKMETK